LSGFIAPDIFIVAFPTTLIFPLLLFFNIAALDQKDAKSTIMSPMSLIPSC
jgi:hypothetical protein